MKTQGLYFVIVSLCFIFIKVSAQQSDKQVKIDAIPHEISWVNSPSGWEATGNTFIVTGGKGSRLFVDPILKNNVNTAPMALFTPADNFLFSCKLKVGFDAVFDAGVLMVYGNADQWAKLCFEYSPQLKPMVVSVVNNQLSDDSNHDIIDGNEVYLRIAGLGNGVYAFHYSTDGNYWNMVRYFYLNPDYDLRVGFLSQSPRGEACSTVFSEIKYIPEKLEDLRSGK